MMITVRFFASYRETLDCDQLQLDLKQNSRKLSELKAELADKGQIWSIVLNDSKALVAVNQTMTRGDCELNDGDEVAFFPPVTGG